MAAALGPSMPWQPRGASTARGSQPRPAPGAGGSAVRSATLGPSQPMLTHRPSASCRSNSLGANSTALAEPTCQVRAPSVTRSPAPPESRQAPAVVVHQWAPPGGVTRQASFAPAPEVNPPGGVAAFPAMSGGVNSAGSSLTLPMPTGPAQFSTAPGAAATVVMNMVPLSGSSSRPASFGRPAQGFASVPTQAPPMAASGETLGLPPHAHGWGPSPVRNSAPAAATTSPPVVHEDHVKRLITEALREEDRTKVRRESLVMSHRNRQLEEEAAQLRSKNAELERTVADLKEQLHVKTINYADRQAENKKVMEQLSSQNEVHVDALKKQRDSYNAKAKEVLDEKERLEAELRNAQAAAQAPRRPDPGLQENLARLQQENAVLQERLASSEQKREAQRQKDGEGWYAKFEQLNKDVQQERKDFTQRLEHQLQIIERLENQLHEESCDRLPADLYKGGERVDEITSLRALVQKRENDLMLCQEKIRVMKSDGRTSRFQTSGQGGA